MAAWPHTHQHVNVTALSDGDLTALCSLPCERGRGRGEEGEEQRVCSSVCVCVSFRFSAACYVLMPRHL